MNNSGDVLLSDTIKQPPDPGANKRNIVFVVNPIAGHTNKENFPSLVDKYIDSKRFNTSVEFTRGQGHATQITADAVKQGADIVVAVGGDGTINEVARCLIHTNTTLGIIPSGSGNGLARHLNIPVNFEKALQIINTGHNCVIDTAQINNVVFVSIAGVGFDALVAKLFAKDPHRGFLTYFKIVASRYPLYRPKKYRLVLDNDKVIETEALFIALANSNQFGYNTTIAPEAKLNDGLLDVCIVQKPYIFEMPIVINLLFLNMIHRSRYVEIHKTKKISLYRDKNRTVNLDGEPVKIEKDLHIEIVPSSLNVIIANSLLYEEEKRRYRLFY